ncbi:MAG: hypothetical protein P1Q69_16550 [Candidatus Thorarchaeota archaeon]|nr:hypothetical protein [Candidatus Thorarchaeota archaeon]
MKGYTSNLLHEILNRASASWFDGESEGEATQHLLGSLYQNASKTNTVAVTAATAKTGARLTDFSSLLDHTSGLESILSNCRMIDSTVDLLITSLIDTESFGSGFTATQRIASEITSPMLSIADEIYSSPAALSEILGMTQQLGDLHEKKITISWGFGSRFDLPNVAHSMALLLPMLGADVTIAAPTDFGLLKRVIREASSVANSFDREIQTTNNFDSIFSASDAIFACNWRRFDDYQRPERNEDVAANYRNWYFESDIIPSQCKFFSPSPVQTDLLADAATVARFSSSLDEWLKRKIFILVTTMEIMLKWDTAKAPLVLL